MKKRVLSYLVIFASACMLLSGCTTLTGGEQGTETNKTETNESGENDSNEKESETSTEMTYVDTNGYLENDQVFVVGVESLPYSDMEIYEQLFSLNNRIEVDIDITDEELLKLQMDYEKYEEMGSKSPIYRDASMNITITTTKESFTYHIPNIGVRMKGNTSRTSFYNSFEGQYNLIHLRVKFTEEEFAALDALELKWNRNDDRTYVREIYAYDMYRDLGILAPHVNLASVDFGGIHQGVFNIYEPVDKLFIEKRVAKEDQDGDLYKCAWSKIGADLTLNCTVGLENEDICRFYNYDLKNNKKTSYCEPMKQLLKGLNGYKVDRDKLEELVDMESFLRFSAVSYFVGNPDDMRNDYNNYYIYFMKSTGKAVFIPYDCDRVLGVTHGWNPTGDGMTGVSPFSTMAEGARQEQPNPLIILTVQEGGYYIDEYILQLKIVAASKWMTNEHFNEYYYIAKNNYFDYTTPEKTFYNAEGHDFSFDLEASVGLNSDWENASFADYVEAILETYNRCMAEYN